MLKDFQILNGKIEIIITNNDTGSLSSQFDSIQFNLIQEAKCSLMSTTTKTPKTSMYVKEIKDEQMGKVREVGVGDKTLQNLLVRRII